MLTEIPVTSGALPHAEANPDAVAGAATWLAAPDAVAGAATWLAAPDAIPGSVEWLAPVSATSRDVALIVDAVTGTLTA